MIKISEQDILYSLKEKLTVVTLEDLFGKINECHTAVGHLSMDQIWHEVIFDKQHNFINYLLSHSITRSHSFIPPKTEKFSLNYVFQSELVRYE